MKKKHLLIALFTGTPLITTTSIMVVNYYSNNTSSNHNYFDPPVQQTIEYNTFNQHYFGSYAQGVFYNYLHTKGAYAAANLNFTMTTTGFKSLIQYCEKQKGQLNAPIMKWLNQKLGCFYEGKGKDMSYINVVSGKSNIPLSGDKLLSDKNAYSEFTKQMTQPDAVVKQGISWLKAKHTLPMVVANFHYDYRAIGGNLFTVSFNLN